MGFKLRKVLACIESSLRRCTQGQLLAYGLVRVRSNLFGHLLRLCWWIEGATKNLKS